MGQRLKRVCTVYYKRGTEHRQHSKKFFHVRQPLPGEAALLNDPENPIYVALVLHRPNSQNAPSFRAEMNGCVS